MDAKQACDKLNGFNFQNRYLVGMFMHLSNIGTTRRRD
jgi:pre-mRNA branch site protein p14